MAKSPHPTSSSLTQMLCYRSPHEGEFWCYRLLTMMGSKQKVRFATGVLESEETSGIMDIITSIPEDVRNSDKRLKYALEAWKAFHV